MLPGLGARDGRCGWKLVSQRVDKFGGMSRDSSETQLRLRGPLFGSSNKFTSFTFAIVKLIDGKKWGLGAWMVNEKNARIFTHIYLLWRLCRGIKRSCNASISQ